MKTRKNRGSKREDQKLNSAVEDGGGCVEMWETMSELRRKDESTSRRNVLGRMGTIAIGGITASVLPGTAGAKPEGKRHRDNKPEEVEADPNRAGEIEEKTGSEARKAIATALGSTEYRHLRKYLLKNYRYRADAAGARVFEVFDRDGVQNYVVGFYPEYRGSPKRAPDGRADVAVTIRGDSVMDAEALVLRNKNGEPNEVTGIRLVDGEIETGAVLIDELKESNGSNDELTTQSSFLPDIDECGICVDLIDILINTGCGASAAIVCASTSLVTGPLAPGFAFACGAIAFGLCDTISDGVAGDEDIEEFDCFIAGFCERDEVSPDDP